MTSSNCFVDFFCVFLYILVRIMFISTFDQKCFPVFICADVCRPFIAPWTVFGQTGSRPQSATQEDPSPSFVKNGDILPAFLATEWFLQVLTFPLTVLHFFFLECAGIIRVRECSVGFARYQILQTNLTLSTGEMKTQINIYNLILQESPVAGSQTLNGLKPQFSPQSDRIQGRVFPKEAIYFV